jgi:hypothetical protein
MGPCIGEDAFNGNSRNKTENNYKETVLSHLARKPERGATVAD